MSRPRQKRGVMADTEFTELAGPRLTLRRFRPADAPVFAAYRSVPEVAR